MSGNSVPPQNINRDLQSFALQIEQFVQILEEAIKKIRSEFEGSWSPIHFSPLQATLFKVLAVLLLFTIGLIGYFWKEYGKVITEKFVRPSTLKEIEELKLSVAKLKLPKEHSPRI